MASPSEIHLTAEDTGIFKIKDQDSTTAAKVSELLQENHEKHHIFFNHDGFHNHIVHHLLTLYGVGASASVIEKHYENNASYQRPPLPVEERVVQDMSDPEHFKKYLGNEKYYHDFLVFFQKEMESRGFETVLDEFLFAGTEKADDLLGRMYGGFFHPIIHLGFGLEFKQPAIIAEALAQGAVHDSWTGKYLLRTEAAAKSNNDASVTTTLLELLDEIRANKKLATSAHWGDANKIRDGILVRAPEEMIRIASKWIVTPETLERKTAEMTNAAIYFTVAAQRPPKQVKFDFFYMHFTNTSIFFPTFNALPFLSSANKVRLLQWKAYLDLALYTSRAAAPLDLAEISLYTPSKLEAGDAEWPGILRRLTEVADDGHAVKFGRAVANAERLCKPYEDAGDEVGVLKAFMWEKIGNMIIDSVEDSGERWVRGTGFAEAWENFEDHPRTLQL
ncbi:related to HypA-like protein [Rhynchosporium agropyri]|uniref:Related to HypA-like protein n=1 Tax=Rhynchosporium agropyri TaxID=914238 RepID=A0A1E1KG53_9HELO|nr:related to HypA-like protein [Rhynchosporium agropyri]